MNNKKGIFLERLDSLIGEKFGNYSKYIIQERALPDLRDGLKPVQRRILYAMNIIKLSHTSAYKKSARVVGDVIGKYHPHGDSSVYEAMVRLGQEWKLNIPLVDMHGNKGSIDGDSPAAMRYTETRLGPISQYLLAGLEKELVQFSPNFDDSEMEPTVMPARFPNLLVNGSTGIASGYSTNIPPHNIIEVIKALIFVFENESVTLSNLTKFIKGPDFPTGGIVNTENVKEAYKTGKGKVVLRAKTVYDEKKNELHIMEIPFETNKSELVKRIDDLIRTGKVSGIKEVRDDTDRNGLQITILLRPNSNIDLISNFLYKHTDLQKNYNINMVAIKEKKPELLGLLDIITTFASFQIKIFTNLYKYELEKLENRLEIVEGLIKVVDIIDQVIALIRKSSNKGEAKLMIINKFKFTDRQVEAIVNLRLYRLTSTDINELQKEESDLKKEVKHYSRGLKDQTYLKSQIINGLNKLIQEFPIKRKSKIDKIFKEIQIDEKDLIIEEKVVVVVSYQGYVKKTSLKSRELSEGVAGRRDDDLIISSFSDSNMNNLVLFSSTGRYYVVPIFKLKDTKWKAVGNHVSTFTGMNGSDRIIAIASIKDFEVDGNLVISTKNGLIKQTEISNLVTNLTKKGAKYTNLKDEDEVISISVATSQDAFAISVTERGNALKYSLDNIPIIGLAASGVRNVNLANGDKVVATIIQSVENVDSNKSQALVFASNGKAKRIKTQEVRGSSRGSKGKAIVRQPKSNPFKIINFFNVDLTKEINLLSTDDEYKTIQAKSDIPMSEVGTGLSNIIKNGTKAAFNDLKLNIGTNKKIKPIKIKAKQINLDNILDSF